MKIKTSIVCLTAVFLVLAKPAPAAGNPATRSSPRASSTFEASHRARQTHRPAALSQTAVSGVIQRAIRSNPLQMINPLAPAKYGTAEENSLPDPDAPGKASGINLFSISF